jgi:hypothetical protein
VLANLLGPDTDACSISYVAINRTVSPLTCAVMMP